MVWLLGCGSLGFPLLGKSGRKINLMGSKYWNIFKYNLKYVEGTEQGIDLDLIIPA